MSNNDNLAITLSRDLDGITEVTDTVVDLDTLVQKLLEGTDVENLVGGWLRSVDDELRTTSTSPPSRKSSSCLMGLEIVAYLLRDLGLLALASGFLHIQKKTLLAYCFPSQQSRFVLQG